MPVWAARAGSNRATPLPCVHRRWWALPGEERQGIGSAGYHDRRAHEYHGHPVGAPPTCGGQRLGLPRVWKHTIREETTLSGRGHTPFQPEQ
jgi:hypothetical protein